MEESLNTNNSESVRSEKLLIIFRRLYFLFLIILGFIYQYFDSGVSSKSFFFDFIPSSVGSAIVLGIISFIDAFVRLLRKKKPTKGIYITYFAISAVMFFLAFSTVIIHKSYSENYSNQYNNSEIFDYGLVKDGIYHNDYFNIKMVLPTDWVVQSKEQTENLANLGEQLFAEDDDNVKALIKASEINTANLLSVFQYEVGSPVDYNPSLMIAAENLKIAPGIKNGSDYLFQVRKLMMQSQFKYDYISDKFEFEKINDIDFYKLHTSINLLGLEFKQIYYATVLKGFGIVFIITFIPDEQKDVLVNSMHSLTIEK